MKAPTKEDFRTRLHLIFKAAEARNEPFVDVKSGELHRQVGGDSGTDHRMPNCCAVMCAEMDGDDEVRQSPPSGQGRTLEIRYRIPR